MISEEAHKENIAEIQTSKVLEELLEVLDYSIEELREGLVDIQTEADTASKRGGILALRELLDLLNEVAQ